MIPLKLCRSWQTGRRFAAGLLACFCLLGLVPTGCRRTDDVSRLKNRKADVRREAANSLGVDQDPRAVGPLIDALDDKDADVRQEAAWALGEIGDPRAVGPLIGKLKDPAANVRWQAVEALGKINGPRAVAPLIAALKDADADVREGATDALGQILGKLGTSAVVPLIRRGEPGTEDALIQALNESNDREMAEDFLNCGNSKLEDAAGAWASKHGYRIESNPGRGHVGWGSKL
jgi:hypothetical protein